MRRLKSAATHLKIKDVAASFSLRFLQQIKPIPYQTYLHLDFEESIPDGKPKKGEVGGEGYAVQVDTTTVYSGTRPP